MIFGWLVAAAIRVATGSATVSITLAAGIMAPVAVANLAINRELLVVAMGAGSMVLSHVNDGGFWFVKEYLNMTVAQTLKTWEQGRFIRFNGLAQWLGWMWPYAALAYVLLRVSRGDPPNRMRA